MSSCIEPKLGYNDLSFSNGKKTTSFRRFGGNMEGMNERVLFSGYWSGKRDDGGWQSWRG
jgi:hypothetical protein